MSRCYSDIFYQFIVIPSALPPTVSSPHTLDSSSSHTISPVESSRIAHTYYSTEEYARMDSKMDVDVGKLPEPHRLSPATEPQSIPTLDGWIENLMNCKQLAENDVQRLCDRVCLQTSFLRDEFAGWALRLTGGFTRLEKF